MFPDLTRDDVFRLETQRLWLRWPRAADAATITAFASLPEVAQMTAAIPHPYPAQEADRFIFKARADNAAGRALHLALTRKNGPRAVFGLVSAIAEGPQEVELGYAIAPEMWDQGFATEAARIVIDTVFALTPATRILANSRVNNPASRAVLEKLGFTYADTGLDPLPARGGLHPCDRFRFERSKWRAAGGLRVLPPMVHQHDGERLADPKAAVHEY
ncbi:MAG: GNAT family N-acetyltransferase [Pseudomonadota bacterium]